MINKNNLYLKYLFVAVFITTLLFVLNSLWWRTYGGDTEWYIAAAEGRWDELIQPYSARFLHPFLAGLLSRLLSLSIGHAFLVIGVVSVFLFFVVNAVILKKTIDLKPILFLPLFFSPYFLLTVREIFEPDAFYIFLSALFFLLLFYKKEVQTLLMFFLMFLTRESTSLLGIILGLVSWFRSKRSLAIGVFIVLFISFLTTSLFGSIGRSNVHNLNSSVYLVAKFSFNFLTNVLGLKPWTNTYVSCEPVFKFQLPTIESFRDIKEIGLCGFNILAPIQTLIILLTIFGITPILFFYLFFKKWDFILKELPLWIIVVLVYGLAHYFIGVVAGTGIQRIVGYGWPAFLLLTPIFISKFLEIDKKSILKFSLLQFFVAWLPLIVYRLNGDNLSSALFILFIVLGMSFYSLKIIKKQRIKENIAFSPYSW